MDPGAYIKDDEVSDPLKHLLSLNWESSAAAVSKMKDMESKNEPLKPVKKVHFSDEVLQVSCDSFNESVNVLPIFEENVDKNSNEMSVFKSLSTKTSISMCYDKTSMKSSNNNSDKIDCSTNEGLNFESKMFVMQKNETNLDSRQNYLSNSSYMLKVNEANDLATHADNISMQVPTSHNSLSDMEELKEIPTSSKHNILDLEGNYKILHGNSNEHSASHLKNRINSKSSNLKQSWKLNSVLTKDLNFADANELKTAVFKAWCKVKAKTDPHLQTASSNTINKDDSLKKTDSKHAYLLWKKSKTKALTDRKKDIQEILITHHMYQGKSKEDLEEKEMVFNLWKKQKDEILKQRTLNEYRTKRQHLVATLNSDSEKRKDAEAAFSAWKAHKSSTMKMEQRKSILMLLKEKEDNERKSSRDKEALDMYNLWLEQKHSSVKFELFNPVKVKPPWIPPGKS